MDLKDIKPYSNNGKKHPVRQLEQIAAILREVGWQQPIKLGADNTIIVGHGRFEAYKMFPEGIREPWVIDSEGKTVMGGPEEKRLSLAQEKAYRLADNKLNESDWVMDAVDFDLEWLKNNDFDVSLTGFEIEKEPEEDDFDTGKSLKEPKYKVERGEVWQLGDHRLMCGDATNSEDVQKLMKGMKSNMMFTDPPYNVNYSGKNELLNLYDKGNNIQTPLKNDLMSEKEYIKFTQLWFQNCLNTLSDYNSVYVCGNYESLMGLYTFSGFTISNILVWMKNSIILGRMDYKGQHENILYGWKDHHHWHGPNNESTIWQVKKPSKSDLHPTMKPIELCARAIKNSSKEGEIVLDLFGGSGSTLIACEQLNRKCFMMEIDPVYCSVIMERWEKLTSKNAVKI